MENDGIDKQEYFQDYMPGNICFGCGADNPEGLQIKSFWEGEESVCIWHSQEKYHGWPSLMNGGIMATLVDCHCMGTAMAYAYKIENRSLNSEPSYRYATGTLSIRYIKPTSNDDPIELRAKIIEVKGKKTTVACNVYSKMELSATAEVIAIRVYDSSLDDNKDQFAG